MYLASSLRRAAFTVAGILFNHDDWDVASLQSEVERFDPDVVAFGVITGEHIQCLEVSRQLRAAHHHITLLGGPFLTFAPETIEHHDHIDAIARGECEISIVDFCERLRSGADHTTVPNLWVRSDVGIVKNGMGPLPDLDELPYPDREVFSQGRSDGLFNLVTSRGCPYKCTYCFNDRFVELYRPQSKGGQRLGEANAPVVRNRSIDDVIGELSTLASDRQVTQFNFHDDIFPMRSSRTLEFCDAYRAAQLNIPWSCSVKAELLDAHLVDQMAEAGCNKVYMGVEAGNDTVRKELLLRRVDRIQMVEAAGWIHASGIGLYTQSMVGLPGTTLDDDLDTMRFNATLAPDFAWVSIFTPYPGTELADKAFEMGLVEPDFMDWMPNTYHYRSILDTPHADQVSNLHKLFSLGVEYPELIDAIGEVARASTEGDIDALHETVFLPFRSWKHDLLREPTTPLPVDLAHFLDALRLGDPAATISVAHQLRVPVDEVPVARWTNRDGVDATIGPRYSADRQAATP